MAYDLGDYIEVPDRIVKFKDAYPDGSLQGEWELKEIGGKPWIVYVAKAYRTPDDERPGIGMAWEPFPGKTPYTEDSELMNAETSAWGRAIVALGFLAKGEKIASANEVRSRSGGSVATNTSEAQVKLIERLAKKNGISGNDLAAVESYATTRLKGGGGGSASRAIDALNGKLDGTSPGDAAAQLLEAAEKWSAGQQEIPADTSDLETAPHEEGAAIGGE